MFFRTRVTAFFAVTVLLVLTAAALASADASDAGSPTISIQEIEAAPNKDVTLDVYISDNPGISEIQIKFLVPTDLHITGVTSDLMHIQDGTLSGNFYTVDAISSGMMTQSGTLMTLHIHTPDREPNILYHIYAHDVQSTPPVTFETVRGTINLDTFGVIDSSQDKGNDGNNVIIGAALVALLILVDAALIALYRLRSGTSS